VNRVGCSKNRVKAFLSLVLVFSCGFHLAAKADSKNEDVWVFDCEHFGSGKYRYSVAKNAIKIVNKSNGSTAITKAPDWMVSCFSDKSKLEWKAPLESFTASSVFAVSNGAKKRKTAKFSSLGKDKIEGLNCLKYKLSDGSIFWVAEDLKTAPQVSEMVSRYFDSPSIDAIPLRILKPTAKEVKATAKSERTAKLQKDIPWLSVKNLQGRPSDNLDLKLSSWKKVAYKDSDFDYPHGYKITKDLGQVILSQQHRKVIEDLVDELSR
jgi:hypothetical protein